LRDVRQAWRAKHTSAKTDAALLAAIEAVRALDVPHLEPDDDFGHVVH
jgi:hypothetical protein